MKEFCKLIDLRVESDPIIAEEIAKVFSGEQEELFKDYDVENDDFDELLGGLVYVVETPEDLKEISTMQENKETGEWRSLFEVPSSYDIAHFVGPNREYVLIALIVCNEGGPSFFIPKEVYEKCPNVTESIKLTEKFWGWAEEHNRKALEALGDGNAGKT